VQNPKREKKKKNYKNKEFNFKNSIRVIDGVRSKFKVYFKKKALGKGLNGIVYSGKLIYKENFEGE
jgi:hypothetical protein